MSAPTLPPRYARAEVDTREWFVARLMETAGMERAAELDMLAGLYAMQMSPPLDMPSAKAEYKRVMAEVSVHLGPEAAAGYDAALRSQTSAELTQARSPRPQAPGAQAPASPTLLSQEQIDAVFNDERVQAALKKL